MRTTSQLALARATVQEYKIVSPNIESDCRVTFRLRAPNAKNVILYSRFNNGGIPLIREKNGVWSVVVGPLAPGIYEYSFNVDDMPMIDPNNRAIKPMRNPRTSILYIPSKPPAAHDFTNVPHGTVHLHCYQSSALGVRRSVEVYTPPGYEKSSGKYPSLYLLHGAGDNEATWVAHGHAHWILDNLIAQRKALPMIVVMPDCHAASLLKKLRATSTAYNHNTAALQRDLLEDIMPLVEKNYRIKQGAHTNAIMGPSMGGGQSLMIGMTNVDRFAWIGGMSSAVFEHKSNLASALSNPKKTNANLKLLWFACGKNEGFLFKRNLEFDRLLTAHDIRHEFSETTDIHGWPAWRKYLADFVSKLFK